MNTLIINKHLIKIIEDYVSSIKLPFDNELRQTTKNLVRNTEHHYFYSEYYHPKAHAFTNNVNYKCEIKNNKYTHGWHIIVIL